MKLIPRVPRSTTLLRAPVCAIQNGGARKPSQNDALRRVGAQRENQDASDEHVQGMRASAARYLAGEVVVEVELVEVGEDALGHGADSRQGHLGKDRVAQLCQTQVGGGAAGRGRW